RPPKPEPERQRFRREEMPKNCRLVKGDAVQCRVWTGPGTGQDVSLGLFHAEEFGNDREAAISAAHRAGVEFKKRYATGRDSWDVIRELQRLTRFGFPIVPRMVLPPLVVR